MKMHIGSKMVLRTVIAKRYVDSEEWMRIRHKKAVVIQCFVRQVQARVHTRALILQKHTKTKAYMEVLHWIIAERGTETAIGGETEGV